MSQSLPIKKKISTAKAAKYLGVSRWTLRRWGDKKLLPFTTSKSGYRYYQEADLEGLKQKNTIVHMVSKKKEKMATLHMATPIVVSSRDETLLLPSPPPPSQMQIQPQSTPDVAVHIDISLKNDLPPVPEVHPAELVVPAVPEPPPPPKQTVLGKIWKILPFTVIIMTLILLLFPTQKSIPLFHPSQNIMEETRDMPPSVISLLSFRDVVLAAATDSSSISDSSVRFFLSGDSESADTMLSPQSAPSEPGNTIYLSNMTSFSSFQDSPFAYLNGSHGPAGPVAIIDNADLLRSHPFFANVHNGDKLLIYRESEKAILFRPLTNEVVAFAPLDAVPSSSYEQIEGQPVVALRNGMGTPYDMKTFEAELTFVAPDSVVVDNTNASRGNYPKSMLIDVVGTKKEEARVLANKLRLSVSDLPDGEFRPPAGVDFLVILGKDRIPLMNYIAPSSTASATPSPKP